MTAKELKEALSKTRLKDIFNGPKPITKTPVITWEHDAVYAAWCMVWDKGMSHAPWQWDRVADEAFQNHGAHMIALAFASGLGKPLSGAYSDEWLEVARAAHEVSDYLHGLQR